MPPRLLAIADLHVEVPENRRFTEGLRPGDDGDWLILCGDVGEVMADVEWGLDHLARMFAKVVWVPGNHELWTRSDDPVELRGDARYQHIVSYCREHGIATPEDPFPVWNGAGGPAVVAPLFTLYDYSFGVNVGSTKAESLARAEEAGIVCTDEFLLHPEPHGSIEDWCAERLRITRARLDEEAGDTPSVLVNHFPLLRELTAPLMYPEFAQWCGTVATADWHTRYRAAAVVYGHLHIPRTTEHDGVRFHEVSLGYPRQWARRSRQPTLRRILPEEGAA
ncbi:MAG TPA: metallophosphoesterase [Thermoleophilaceae bacterium]|jgi:3',5'-cyclic AMP phosphodiesterase CpdA